MLADRVSVRVVNGGADRRQAVAPRRCSRATAALVGARRSSSPRLQDKHDSRTPRRAAALTKSGTSTLELALARVPMAVTYRVNPLITAAIARRLIRVEHVAMVNLLAGRRLVPELLQQDCTPERLSQVVWELLSDGSSAVVQKAAFRGVMESLRTAGEAPSAAAARAVLELVEK